MRRCSSVSRSGVKTPSGSDACRSHWPPRGTGVVDAVVTGIAVLSCTLENTGGPHASTDAHGDQAVAGAPALHFIEQAGRQLGAGATEGMPERDRATVDVKSFRVDREFLENRQHLRGKGLVQLDDVHLLQGETCLLEHLSHGGHGTDSKPLRLDAGYGKRHEACQGLEA